MNDPTRQRLARIRVWMDDEPRAAAAQMALDEALSHVERDPVLRFYRWAAPALSFGYFQAWDEVKPFCANRDAVRRWTGGGMVEHGDDITYSLCLPKNFLDAAGWGSSSSNLYGILHEGLLAALRECGENALTLFSGTPISRGGACFAAPVGSDIIGLAGKIAGAAQRRTRFTVLHQGSIQSRVSRRELAHVFASWIARNVAVYEPSQEIFDLGDTLVTRRYGTEAWLHRA